VSVVDETGSTNADLLAEARAGAPHRTVLAARHQTAGRGRLDRRWESPPGVNLMVSVLLRDLPTHPHVVTQRVALAARAAAQRVSGLDVRLKWPNDLLVGDAKLAGVLTEAGGTGGIDFLVTGVGMNVGWAPQGAARLGAGIDPIEVLRSMLEEFDALPEHDVHSSYRTHLATIGRHVRVTMAAGDIEGRVIDVDADGRLQVLDACGVTHGIDTGDVVHLRPAP
jgi:BirA family biotin operon repressor/biotin-[acetyl-CoA-carboxylase] ligase